MNFSQLKKLLKYANQNAEEISQMSDVNLSKSSLFFDILRCYNKYHVYAFQYKKEKFWQITPEQRVEVAKKYELKNRFNEAWAKDFYENYRFLIKWSAFKYEASAKLQKKRIDAYRHRYNIGENCFIGHGVLLHRHHYTDETIKIGDNCHLSEDVNIDFTGGLTLGNKVVLSEGTKIFTHNHVVDFTGADESKGCIKTPLVIQDRAWVGARAIIMPGVSEIGRGAVISSCSYVRSKVPPYAIVMGNPAKIIGFRFPPEEIVKFEEKNYPADQCISIDVLTNNYEKFYHSHWKEINHWVKSLSLHNE